MGGGVGVNVSCNWLRRYVDIEEDPGVLAEDLTMFGLNVESVERVGAEYSGVVFGRVRECRRHPQADRLSVCTVDTGGDRPLNIVCGAPNVRAGLGVAVALQGSVLAGGLKIKKTKLRGEVSEGMICSETELGIGSDASGIIELDLELEPGADLDGKLGAGDTILDIEITPNRPDQLSHIGIAREIAALYNRELRLPPTAQLQVQGGFRIGVEDPADCPRYSAAFIDDVRIGPSPQWMQELLAGAGVKPINNIVDVTNFVLLETGQPMHAFDRDRMKRDEILVRRGRAGERLVTLDGIDRPVGPEILLITDGETPIGAAGVMGGESTEVTPQTKHVLLESAWFGPRAVRGSRRALKLDTEASYRFERECDPGGTVAALERACRLIAETGAGTPQPVCADMLASAELIAPRTIMLRSRQANRVMGTMLAADDLCELLSRLGLEAVVSGKDVTVSVPTFRRDLSEEIDLIEEAARVYGYDDIGSDPGRRNSMFAEISAGDRRNEELCDRLAARGFAEVVTTSFMDPDDPRRLEWADDDPRARPVVIANPLTAAQSVMRTSLLPGMLRVVERNASAGVEGIRIFELDKVFIPRTQGEGLPEEPLRLTALFSRKAAPMQWHEKQRDMDFFDMKGEAEAMLEWLGSSSGHSFERDQARGPDHVFNWLLKNKIVGSCGLIPGRVCARFGIDAPVFFFDVDIDAFSPGWAGKSLFSRISPFPAMKRDLSVTAPAPVRWADIRNVVKKRTKHLESVILFDYYRGESLGEGRRGYTFRLVFRSSEGTLDDATVDAVIAKVLAGLQEELQVALRAE